MGKAPATAKKPPPNSPGPAAPRRAGGARRGGRARPALPRVPPQGGEALMLVSPLDSLRRCECQPTPPMLWLRSDSRLVWHLLGGGCFLSRGGLGGGGGGHRGRERPQGHCGARRGAEGEGGLPPFWEPAERGCGPGGLGGRGVPAAPPQNPPGWPRGQKQQEEEEQQQQLPGLQCPQCPQYEPGLDPWLPAPRVGVLPLGREPLSVWGSERGGSSPRSPAAPAGSGRSRG